MPYSYTISDTFTLTNAKKLAAKVAADMHQSCRIYGRPLISDIERYQEELVVMLHGGYLKTYEFGFQSSDGKRTLSWLYTVSPSGDLEGGRSGGLHATATVDASQAFNYMTYNDAWFALTVAERDRVKAQHPVNRGTGEPPQDGNGFWSTAREYGSGGVALTRKEFTPYGN